MDGQMGYDQLRLAPGARKDLYGICRRTCSEMVNTEGYDAVPNEF